MRLLFFYISLLCAVALAYSTPSSNRSNGPVCGSLYGYTKTFTSPAVFYQDYINSGKLWSFLHPGPCSATSECKTFKPVCAVSKSNNYRTFVNMCSMKADQKMSGTIWRFISNGFCSKQSSQRDASPSATPNGAHSTTYDNYKNSTASLPISTEAVLKFINTYSQALAASESQTMNSSAVSEEQMPLITAGAINTAATSTTTDIKQQGPMETLDVSDSTAPFSLSQPGQSQSLSLYLLSTYPHGDQKDSESSATVKRNSKTHSTPNTQISSTDIFNASQILSDAGLLNSSISSHFPQINGTATKPTFPLAQLAHLMLLLGNSSPFPNGLVPVYPNLSTVPNLPNAPNLPTVPNQPTVPTLPTVPNLPNLPTLPSLPSVPSSPYQTIYNNAVYQGQFNYEPKRSRINFGDFNFLPHNWRGSVFPPTTSGHGIGGPGGITNQSLIESLKNLQTISELTEIDRILRN